MEKAEIVDLNPVLGNIEDLIEVLVKLQNQGYTHVAIKEGIYFSHLIAIKKTK